MKKTKILYWIFTVLFAGLMIDLLGATYSVIMMGATLPQWGFMILPITIGALSYIYHRKKLKEGQVQTINN